MICTTCCIIHVLHITFLLSHDLKRDLFRKAKTQCPAMRLCVSAHKCITCAVTLAEQSCITCTSSASWSSRNVRRCHVCRSTCVKAHSVPKFWQNGQCNFKVAYKCITCNYARAVVKKPNFPCKIRPHHVAYHVHYANVHVLPLPCVLIQAAPQY